MLTTTNISCYEAERIKYLPTDSVLISINNQHEDLHTLKLDRRSDNILTVVFPDITGNLIHQGKKYKVMDGDAALKIINFIGKFRKKSFIIHCTAGISRSAAVCLFINIIYGHLLKDNFWRLSRPNPYVLGKLLTVYYELHQLNVG